jgi:hypothetical protein
MLVTMRMGMPGMGQGRPQWLMPGPKLGAVLLMCRTAASGTRIKRAQLRRVRMAKFQQKGVDSMMLETILALLGLTTCALVLVSFWGSDLFGSRTRKRS